MIIDTSSPAEKARLSSLQSYHILDTAREQDFDELTELASVICGTPMALISLVDANRQWFKSAKGLVATETDRAYSFCAHAILSPYELMEVENAHEDERFKNNPLVTGYPKIAFYAGMPLVTGDGHALGSLCVIDSAAKKLSDAQRSALKTLAKQVIDKLELRRRNMELEKAKEEAAYHHSRVNQMVMSAPMGMCILKGQDFVVEVANEQMHKIWTRKPEDTIGKLLLEIFPELLGQAFPQMLKQVLDTGERVAIPEMMVDIAELDGTVSQLYVDFSYDPLFDINGKPDGVMVAVHDITGSVVARKRLENNEAYLHDVNQQLEATNKELNTAQQLLENANAELSLSHERFKNMIQSSPVAMLVTRGDDMVFEEINEAMLRMIGKDESVKGKPWFEAIPELVGQPVIDRLYHTYRTGEEHRVFEVPILLMVDGQPYHGYYDITYTPLQEDGKITGVMQSVIDVTGYVLAKDELGKAYEQVRLSKEAAELGTFDMNMESGKLEWDPRCRQLFGISHLSVVDFEKDFLANLHLDDLEHVKSTLNRVFDKAASNGAFDVEYRTIGAEDQQLRWVRAKGQVYFGTENQPLRFIGSVLDITEQKQDEQRKNDFIGMASHELKTPLTSLNAYLQVLQLKARKAEDTFLLSALEKSVNQVKKMTTMINGFLNVSRLESGKIHIDKRNFYMAELLKEVEEEYMATISSHKVVFVPAKETLVNADWDKIGQVVNNFISNAIKYSPLGSTIIIDCVTIDGKAQVSVKDEGLGIKPQDQQKLFDRYYRVESNAPHIAGFGIGLYLCAEIIQRHNGKIWLESELGKGSTFFFSLPLNIA